MIESASSSEQPYPIAGTDSSAKLLAVDKALRVSEMRYRRLFEAAQDGILLLYAQAAQTEHVNPSLIKMLGYSHDEFMGRTIWEVDAFKDTALSKDAFMELEEKHFIRYDDLPPIAKDGNRHSVGFVSNVCKCDGMEVIQCNRRDNAKRHVAEIALQASARALRMRGESNVALLSAKTESMLLAEYCRIAVETRGYRMAWIGVAENGSEKRARVVSQHGYDEGYSSAVTGWHSGLTTSERSSSNPSTVDQAMPREPGFYHFWHSFRLPSGSAFPGQQ